MFLNEMSADQLNYDGFFDGQNKTVPDNTELEVAVIDGFIGIEEGKSQQVCMINLSVTTPGEFYGQKYRYNAKIYDMDANKRDLAMRNLGVLDAQAGFPMTNGKLELTTENVQDYWAGDSVARAKFGLFVSEDDGREVNFIRGFAYIREKMRQPAQPQNVQPINQQQPVQQQVQQQPAYQQAAVNDDIDF